MLYIEHFYSHFGDSHFYLFFQHFKFIQYEHHRGENCTVLSVKNECSRFAMHIIGGSFTTLETY